MNLMTAMTFSEVSLVAWPYFPACLFKADFCSDGDVVTGPALVPGDVAVDGYAASRSAIKAGVEYFHEIGGGLWIGHERRLSRSDAAIVRSRLDRRGQWILSVAVRCHKLREQVRSGELTGFSVGVHSRLLGDADDPAAAAWLVEHEREQRRAIADCRSDLNRIGDQLSGLQDELNTIAGGRPSTRPAGVRSPGPHKVASR